MDEDKVQGSKSRSELPPLPPDAVPIVPIRNVALFPGVVMPISLGRELSISAAQEAVRAGHKIALLAQRDASVEKPGAADLYQIGVLATVIRYVTTPEGAHHLVCQGESRFRVVEMVRETPFLAARIEQIPEPTNTSPEIEARAAFLKERATEALSLLPQAPAELGRMITGIDAAAHLADLIVSFMDVKSSEKQEILETFDLKERLDRVIKLLAHRVEVLKITKDITEQTQAALGERQREAVLREQLRQLQKELGEGDSTSDELAELDGQIAQAAMPPPVEEHAVRGDSLVERTRQRRALQADIEVDRLGRLVQAVEMRIEERDSAPVHPQALPHSIPQNETRVEDRNQCLRPRTQLTVDVDEDVAVARVVGRMMRPLCHALHLLSSHRARGILARENLNPFRTRRAPPADPAGAAPYPHDI